MTGAREPDVDPRFDARFQRGFDGEPEAPGATRSRPPGGDPASAAAPGGADRAANGAAGTTDAGSGDAADHDRPRRPWNPFLLALPVVSLLMIAAGVALLAHRADPDTRFADRFSLELEQVLWLELAQSAPTALFAGAVVGLLLALALQAWRRDRA